MDGDDIFAPVVVYYNSNYKPWILPDNTYASVWWEAADMRHILADKGISIQEAAYMGDDINDLACMQMARVKGCPQDAVQEIRKIADYVTERAGGNGAVREFVEWIQKEGMAILA